MTISKHQIDFRYGPPSRWTCIGLPDDEHKSLVREDVALLYKYTRNVFSHGFNRIIEFRLLTNQEPIRIEQHAEPPRRAIVVTKILQREKANGWQTDITDTRTSGLGASCATAPLRFLFLMDKRHIWQHRIYVVSQMSPAVNPATLPFDNYTLFVRQFGVSVNIVK